MTEVFELDTAHIASNVHVSQSEYAIFFGSKDLGCRLHIPAEGPERRAMKRAEEKAAQALRCKILRGEVKPSNPPRI
jgi:hypothetical protein